MKRKLITLPRVIWIIIILFIVIHITPQMALRTHLFFTGYPKFAFTSKVEEFERGEENKRIKFYTLNPPPIDRSTGNELLAYKITRIGFLYIATYHGGG